MRHIILRLRSWQSFWKRGSYGSPKIVPSCWGLNMLDQCSSDAVSMRVSSESTQEISVIMCSRGRVNTAYSSIGHYDETVINIFSSSFAERNVYSGKPIQKSTAENRRPAFSCDPYLVADCVVEPFVSISKKLASLNIINQYLLNHWRLSSCDIKN